MDEEGRRSDTGGVGGVTIADDPAGEVERALQMVGQRMVVLAAVCAVHQVVYRRSTARDKCRVSLRACPGRAGLLLWLRRALPHSCT